MAVVHGGVPRGAAVRFGEGVKVAVAEAVGDGFTGQVRIAQQGRGGLCAQAVAILDRAATGVAPELSAEVFGAGVYLPSQRLPGQTGMGKPVFDQALGLRGPAGGGGGYRAKIADKCEQGDHVLLVLQPIDGLGLQVSHEGFDAPAQERKGSTVWLRKHGKTDRFSKVVRQ